MVQTSESSYTYEVPLETIILAHNQRYPSPYGTHILSSDVISREFDPATGVLKTTRLMNKRGKMPKWAPAFISQIGTSWVLERTEVDLAHSLSSTSTTSTSRRRELRTASRNLDHTKIMQVEEFQVFSPAPDNSLATDSMTYSRITSDLDFWLLRDRVEKYGLSKLAKSVQKARLGLDLIATLVLQPSTSGRMLSSGPLRPYAFDPVPSALSLALRAKLDEARQAWLLEERGRLEPATAAADNDASAGRDKARWRERWRDAVRRGRERFRDRVCRMTGLLCHESTSTTTTTTSLPRNHHPGSESLTTTTKEDEDEDETRS
ncbi:hypothetical protein JCM11491_001136 [Sporobolomyces phaffii]